MANICNSEQHVALMRILDARNRPSITPNMPLWKLKLTEEEYTNLKKTLVQNAYRLEDFGIEAALCYAEWWRRDYNGGIPSREDVAVGLGLPRCCWEQLYKAARHGLKSHGFTFIHSLKGNEYFRTLLNQGGLPVNYIKNGTNLSGFSRFLIGLIEELSSINIDWDDSNLDLIKNFNCIAYLGKAFKNDNIYDVSLQIAHAIISEEDRWLPYDDADSSLSELTKSLKREYRRVKSEYRTKPLSLSWKLRLTSSETASLFVNLNVVKEISSKSIEGLDYQSCYTFDVFVAGVLVGKYVRKSLVKDDEGEVVGAIYSRITVGVVNDIKWNGEPVVEVKIRCDNDDRLFPTLCGSYPPNFECPQVFQMLDDNVYALKSTANAENNIAVFSTDWKCDGSHNLLLNGELYSAIEFADKVGFHNCMSNEDVIITNEFTPYSAEFRGTYIQWVEQSNFKLLTRIPVISVFDQTGTRVGNIKPKYRVHNSKTEWRNLSNACLLPFGLVDIKVEFPDNKYVMETFYFIDDMTFVSRNEGMFSTELRLESRHIISAKVCECEDLSVEMIDKNTWKISRDACASKYSPTCNLKIIAEGNPPLRVSVAVPFEGIVISDLEGKIVPSGKIISYDNLRYFNIISHGRSGMIDVTYKSDKITDGEIKHLKSPVIEGIVPLSDYRDLFARMYQLYGANTFDRSSSIELRICDKRIYIRKFVLDSELDSDKIRIKDYTSEDNLDFIYDGDVYALPVAEDIKPAELVTVKLEAYNRQMNLFTIPDELLNSEVILFSGPESSRRLVPKYYNFGQEDYSLEVRGKKSAANIMLWDERLSKDDVFAGEYWKKTVTTFRIISEFNLPFTTCNAFKAISCDSKLLVNLILACWLNDASNLLIQEIDRFEDELNIAVHWIPRTVWGECIESLISSLPSALCGIMVAKLGEITELINRLLNATLSTEVASELTQYVVGEGKIGCTQIFSNADINRFKSRIHGYTDNNIDLPLIRFVLKNKYYADQKMHASYRVMIEAAMCAAENLAQVEDCINLFSLKSRDYARIINFYRKYFKETYSEIFIGTVKQIVNK